MSIAIPPKVAPAHISFADVLAPTSVEEFVREITARKFVHHSPGTDRFAQLMTWNDVNRMLDTGALAQPRLWVLREGVEVADSEFNAVRQPPLGADAYNELNSPELARLLNGGSSILINAIDMIHPPARALVEEMERVLGFEIACHAFISFHAARAVSTHWDPVDAFILQISGHKRWRVWDTTRKWPLVQDSADNPKPDQEPQFDRLLEPGDFFHLPRGVWHDASAVDGPSIHLSFTLRKPTASDMLAWLAEQAADLESFREDLPLPGVSLAEDTRLMRALEKDNAALWHDALTRFRRAYVAAANPRPHMNLPHDAYRSRMPEHDDFAVRGRGRYRPEIVDVDGMLEIGQVGRQWRFAAEARPMLELVADLESHAISEWFDAAPGLPREKVLRFVAELLEHELIEVDRHA